MSVSEAVPASLAGREYSFRMIGGELEGKRLYIAGFPRFQEGEKVVLFLNSQTSSVFGPTIGLWQGVFFVEKDASTGAETPTDYKRRPIIGVRDRQLAARGANGRTYRALLFMPSLAERQAVPWANSLRTSEFFKKIRVHRVFNTSGPSRQECPQPLRYAESSESIESQTIMDEQR